MPLTPIDIQQKTFGPELRGYNMDEVDDFLDEVVATLKDYDQRVRDAQDRIRALEAEVATRGEDETAISRALVAAQKQADAIVAEAHAEAESIRTDAHTESDRLRAERDAERLALTQDIARMRATVADLKRRIVELAASAEDDLDRMDALVAEAAADIDQGIPGEASAGETPGFEPASELDSDSAAGDIGDWGDRSDDFETPSGPTWDQDEDVPWEASEETEDEAGQLAEDEDTDEDLVDLDSEGDDFPAEEYSEDDDRSEEVDETEEAEAEEEPDFGTLAERMAREASPADDVSPSSRRPWERGSV